MTSFRNRYNNAQPAHAQSVRVGHTGAVTGLELPQERQGKVSAKIQQLLNTLKVCVVPIIWPALKRLT